MRRLGAVLLVILLVSGMNVRSVWSGGGKWGSGTPSGARTDAYWLPDGQTPTGRPFPDVAIGGTLVQDKLQSASWSLGIPDFLSDLSPSTATLTFVGQVSGTPGDEVVISSAIGGHWSGRLDTVTQTRDTAGDYWTTITATDRVGALGAAELRDEDVSASTDLETLGERLAAEAGITLDILPRGNVDLPTLTNGSATYSGSVLSLINGAARASNRMLALSRNGKLLAVPRESRNRLTVNDSGGYGTFSADTGGWAAYAGGSIARSTTTPIRGVADAQVTATTTQYSGAVFSLAGRRFLAGRTYRLQMDVERISGEQDWYIQLWSDTATTGAPPSTSFVATSTPTLVSVDLTPDFDATDLEIHVGVIDAVPTAGVLAIDNVEVFEVGTPLTGSSAAQTWETTTSVDSVINSLRTLSGGTPTDFGADSETTALYGLRQFEAIDFEATISPDEFSDWNFYFNEGYGIRDIGSGSFVVSSWTQDDLLLLEPFQWVTEGGVDWQILSVAHNVTASPYSWTINVTADSLGEDMRQALLTIFSF